MKTRITELLGIEHPIFQAAMSWASSNAPLVVAVSNAGGLGVLAGGPMRVDDFRKTLLEIKNQTRKPFGVNNPLNNPRAPQMLDIAAEAGIPVMIASQGAERAGASKEELEALFDGSNLKQAALDGDVEWGKLEAGQSAGLVDEILPAAEVMQRLVREMDEARKRISAP